MSPPPDDVMPVVDADRLRLEAPLDGWSADRPDEARAAELAELLRRHEEAARGWPGASDEELLVQLSERGYQTRDHLVLRDADGAVRGWATAHDRASGRLLFSVVVDPQLAEGTADAVAATLFGWGERAAARVGAQRGLDEQQIDSGSFAGDERQHRWLERAGFAKVRTWWQMSRPVTAEEAGTPDGARPETGPETRPETAGVRIRRVRRQGTGMPDEDDLRTVHDIVESAFADHFNSHHETFDEFLSRLREDPGHRWDHWWIAELVHGSTPRPAGALVGAVVAGQPGPDGAVVDGSYVEYIGVLENARGRGVAKGLLATAIADAAARGRDRVGLEVDADSPTGADRLYLSLGWTTSYVTESWHRTVALTGREAVPR